MAQLSPILPFRDSKDERRTNGLPAFYLLETIDGSRGLMASISTKQLNRVQAPSPTGGRSGDPNTVFHAVYWHENPIPKLIDEPMTAPSMRELPATSRNVLEDYFSDVVVTVIGDEQRLDSLIQAGTSSVPVVLWDGNDSRLPWLHCHRVVRDVEWFQSGWMVCLAREHLFFRDITSELLKKSDGGFHLDVETVNRMLLPVRNEGVVMLAITRDGSWRIHSEPGWADGLLQHHHPSLREIGSVQLEHIVLPKGLNLSPSDRSLREHVSVFHHADQAVAALRNGAQVAYLLNPLRTEQLRELIKQGQMLPADSVALDTATFEVWNYAR